MQPSLSTPTDSHPQKKNQQGKKCRERPKGKGGNTPKQKTLKKEKYRPKILKKEGGENNQEKGKITENSNPSTEKMQSHFSSNII